jgi:hypothetical protein
MCGHCVSPRLGLVGPPVARLCPCRHRAARRLRAGGRAPRFRPDPQRRGLRPGQRRAYSSIFAAPSGRWLSIRLSAGSAHSNSRPSRTMIGPVRPAPVRRWRAGDGDLHRGARARGPGAGDDGPRQRGGGRSALAGSRRRSAEMAGSRAVFMGEGEETPVVAASLGTDAAVQPDRPGELHRAAEMF